MMILHVLCVLERKCSFNHLLKMFGRATTQFLHCTSADKLHGRQCSCLDFWRHSAFKTWAWRICARQWNFFICFAIVHVSTSHCHSITLWCLDWWIDWSIINCRKMAPNVRCYWCNPYVSWCSVEKLECHVLSSYRVWCGVDSCVNIGIEI